MTSEARVAANRRNAEKSTGPRTPEGKAIVSQNAVKHGLLARQAVLKDEDPQEFELHRRRMLERLAPDGPEEELTAERVVALWWRLKRAERMQDESLDYLIEADRGDGWVKHRRSDGDPSAAVELTFGRAVARDFAERRSLDRLMMYEQRIESALYRTRNELRRLQLARKAGGGQCPPYKSESAGEESDCAKQSQSEEVSSVKSVETQDFASPQAVVMRSHHCAEQSQSAREVPCETKPIGPGSLTHSVPAGASAETQDLASLQEQVAASETDCAKQSQCPGSATGPIAVLRPRPRVACHYHDVPRSS